MSMWQGDWKEFEIDGTKRWVVAFIDDSSRLITCYGVFDSPTTQNTITVLNQGFAEYGAPRDVAAALQDAVGLAKRVKES